MATVTHETFAGREGETFHVALAGGEATGELELTAVDVADAGDLPEGLRRPFTLLFAGDKANVLPEGIYRFEVGASEAAEIYLIPIVSAGARQSYQAVFN